MNHEIPTAVVVGGASGIGLASAQALAADGWALHLVDIDHAALESAADLLTSEDARVTVAAVDITSSRAVEECFVAVEDSNLQGLVNAAGILQLGTLLDITEVDWDRMLQTNLRGAFLTCKAAVPRFGPGSAIVNIVSQSGRTKSYYSAPNYVAAKAGLIGLTMSVAAQHAEAGIRANAVAPGLVETPMIAKVYTQQQRESMMGSIPMGRFAAASEVAEVVAFLMSPRSSYVTGQTINVNGGSFMQ